MPEIMYLEYLSLLFMFTMESFSVDHRFCLHCKDFLPAAMFKSGARRTLCKTHFNKRMDQIKQQKWCEKPQQRQAKIVWQIAYIDSVKTFKMKIDITPAVVLAMLQQFKISLTTSVRLVPVDPALPLSDKNFCLTSIVNRKDMCGVWKQLNDQQSYSKFLDPKAMRPIYAIS
jgi:hypothetical protein